MQFVLKNQFLLSLLLDPIPRIRATHFHRFIKVEKTKLSYL